MGKMQVRENLEQQDVEVKQSKRKKFHGFSMEFLLILLALAVGLYVVCTILAV